MRSLLINAVFAAMGLVLTTAALGQAKFDFGKREYDSSCAVCHGLNGRGDGPYKPFQTKSPSDLTALAKRNNGVFPYQSVYEIIDGREALPAHGPRDMPIWGARYSAQAGAYYVDVPYYPEVFVRTRGLLARRRERSPDRPFPLLIVDWQEDSP